MSGAVRTEAGPETGPEVGSEAGPEVVVCVHGLWMLGYEFLPLGRRLEQEGFRFVRYSYRSTRESLDANADGLAERIRAQEARAVHLVAHSLGGLVVMRALERHPDLPPGRCVLLGSPLRGSRAGQGFARWKAGRRMLGEAAAALEPREPRWNFERECLLIAGSRGVGMGGMVADLPKPHDGTVALDETLVEGVTAHRVVPVSHAVMPFSPLVCERIVQFLKTGDAGPLELVAGPPAP